MTDVRRKETPVSQLEIGMFVTALDRPWLGTPFMLEGLLLEEQEQIAAMAKLCKVVYVDHTVSIGKHFIAPPKEEVGIKRDGITSKMPISANTKSGLSTTKLAKRSPSSQKFTFFNVMKEIQAANQASLANQANNPGAKTTDNILLNVQNINNQIYTPVSEDAESAESTSLASKIKEDFTSFLGGLTSWGSKSKKLKDKTDNNTDEQQGINQATIVEEASLVEDEIAEIYPTYDKSQVATREIFEALAAGQQIDITNVNEALDGMVDSIERNPDALMWLAKLKQTDNYAYNHALNVSITLMAFASFMSFPKAQIKNLGMAGLLQDIGKGKLPPQLLHKEGKISSAEFAVLKRHVDYAIEILKETKDIPESVIAIVADHHERFDGSGYPNELSGKQINRGGQMAGLIDTYCALTTNKVYAKGVYNQVALERINKMADVKFSTALVNQLVQFLGMYPVSSLVELNSGEVGVVIQQNSVRRLLPRVMILLNPDKTKNEYPATINLINSPLTPKGEPYKIVRGLPADSYGLNPSNFYG
ncbi:MAG TPA: HD-GYP domain-containing protein [Methylotenera sp.]|nr:HD-GYP domain-containing protein [Methylotenera sp.]